MVLADLAAMRPGVTRTEMRTGWSRGRTSNQSRRSADVSQPPRRRILGNQTARNVGMVGTLDDGHLYGDDFDRTEELDDTSHDTSSITDSVLFARLDAATKTVKKLSLSVKDLTSKDLDAQVPKKSPPRLSRLVDVVGSVPELNWQEATGSDEQLNSLIHTLNGTTCQLREPVILRGAADTWPCVSDSDRRWTLGNLVKNHKDFAGETRVQSKKNSDSLNLASNEFQYVEVNHPAVKNGAFKSPSVVKELTINEVAKRMTGKQSEDSVYMQAELSGTLAEDAGLGTNNSSEPWRSFQRAEWVETQAPRIWLSQAGSTSSLHYDSSVSVLAQVNGLKRMLLSPPSALQRAYLYPDWHPLRRRSGVRLDADSDFEGAAVCAYPRWAGSDLGVDVRAAEAHGRDSRGEGEDDASTEVSTSSKPPGAWEAVLGPGDVLVFPPRWAHYTESIGPRVSSSVTRRYKVPDCLPTQERFVSEMFSSSADDPHDTAAVARFVRWQKRKGGVSVGSRDIYQLERVNVVRAMSEFAFALDEHGRVALSDVASNANNKILVKNLGGRGGVEQWREQWHLCAMDAARIATSALEGNDDSPSTTGDPLTQIGGGRTIGVYLRGSAARGDAKAGVSDLDLICLAWDDGETAAQTLRDAIRESLFTKVSDGSESKTTSWKQRWSHLPTKCDLKLVLVPLPPHPAGVAVANALDGKDSDTRGEFRSALALSLCAEVSFALAVESVTLAGADVPAMLPCESRVPPRRCAQTLRADVVEALADGGDRSLKWALRRVIRAGFELETGVGKSLSNKKKDSSESFYTRDLFRCATVVAEARPELGEDVAAALVAAVHGPGAVWGAMWYASGAALASRLCDALLEEEYD